MLDYILLITVCIANVLLGLLVLTNNPKAALNRTLAVLTFSFAAWNVVAFLEDAKFSEFVVLMLSKADFLLSIVMSVSFFVFCVLISHAKAKYLSYAVYTLAIINAILISAGLTYTVQYEGSRVIFEPSYMYWLFIGYIALCIISGFILMILKYRTSRGLVRNQLFLVFLGLFLTTITLVTTNIILPNITDVTPAVTRLGIYSTVFMVALDAVAIIRHRLFDIRAAVTRSVAFILSIVAIGTVYGFVAFRFAGVFLQHTSTLFQQSFYTLLAIALAFTFSPMRRFFEKISNRVFYRDRYDAQELVNDVGRILAGEIRLDELCHKVIKELTTQMKLSSADIVVLAEKNVHFQTRVFSSEHHDLLVDDLTKLGRLVVVADDLSGGERKEILQKYQISASLALRTGESFLGYLLLGEKKSGDIYNEEDIRTLKIIANELSVAVQNAKAFAEIQAFNETLKAKVNDATKRLRHANSELKELDEAKDEFISIASHQLRTPLTTVKGYASMISEGDFGKLSAKQKEPVTEILDGSERMNRLVGDLLNVSRIQAGKFYIDTVELDFEQLVAGEVKQLEQLAKSKKVELVYKPPAKKLAPMMLDQNKTEQAVMNLIDNAIHYSASPGGGHVQVSLEVHGNEVVFLVRDDGIGVPRDKQAKLFTKMFRADNAKEVRPDGTGLGLYLVKRVVEDEGGHVVFASEPGKGSTFGFRLPIGGVPKELQQKAKSIAKHVHLSV